MTRKKIEFRRNPEGALIEDSAIRLSSDFGSRVAILCALHQITVSQLESAIGLSRGALNAIVSGKRAGRLTAWIVVLVADALHADIGFLITGRSHDSSAWDRFTNVVVRWPAPLPPLATRMELPIPKSKPAAPKPRKKKPLR